MQRLFGRLLLRFLFAATHTGADHVGIEPHLHLKALVVVRAALSHQHIGYIFPRVLLYHLLQGGFVILKGGGVILQRRY